MKLRLLAPLCVLAISSVAMSADNLQVFFRSQGAVSEVKASVNIANEVIEYKDGDDAITHKRAGKAKYKNIVLKRGFVNTSLAFDSRLKSALGGVVDPTPASLTYHPNRGADETNECDFTGDCQIRFPAAGAFAQDEDGDGIVMAMKAKEKGNRTKCGNNLGEVRRTYTSGHFALGMDGRSVDCSGWSALSVRVQAGDINGDGFPDRVMDINSSDIQFTLSPSELIYVTDWQTSTARAAAQQLPFTKSLTLMWETKDHGFLTVTCKATLVSATVNPNGDIDVVCATEGVSYLPPQ